MKTRNSLKKILGLALALALILTLCPAVFAAQVVLSPQKLTVDGKSINCEKYNIDGSNYFKLRDLAYVLNGTNSQFSVGYDAAAGVVSITTGAAYTPNGSELVVGADKSATAQPSGQTIKINGAVRTDLSVYNIGGNNFFKLRELGDALGFDVGYDAASNTAMVASKCVLIRERDDYSDEYWIEWNYNNKGNLLTREEHYSDGTTNLSEYTYDAQGHELTESYSNSSGDWGKRTYTYDAQGHELTESYSSNYGSWDKRTCTYDAQGRKLTEDYSRSYGSWEKTTYIYDAQGHVVDIWSNSNGGWSETTYTYDAQGRDLTRNYFTSDGYWRKATYTYDAQGRMLTEGWSDSDGYWNKTTYTYDAQGHVVDIWSNSNGGWSETTYTYDAQGHELTESYSGSSGYWYKEVYTYDAQGCKLTEELTGSSFAAPMKAVYTYDSMGRVLTKRWNSISDYGETFYNETVYAYDDVQHTYTKTLNGPPLMMM